MTPYRSGPRPLAPAFERMRAQLAPETLLAEVQAAWLDAVGEAIAAQARPTAERAGVLTVSCSASVWAQELDLMGPAIVARLNSALRRGQLTRLRCVPLPAYSPLERP